MRRAHHEAGIDMMNFTGHGAHGAPYESSATNALFLSIIYGKILPRTWLAFNIIFVYFALFAATSVLKDICRKKRKGCEWLYGLSGRVRRAHHEDGIGMMNFTGHGAHGATYEAKKNKSTDERR